MKLSNKTVDLLKTETLKFYGAWVKMGIMDEDEYWEIVEDFNEAGNDAEKLVQVFIDLAWDLPSFLEFLDKLQIPREDKIALMGIAQLREADWST